MAVRYIDGLEVAVVQSNPIGQSLGLSHRRHCVYQHRVMLAEDERRRDRVEAERFAEGLGPLANHGLSRGGKNVHTERVRRDRRGHARGLFQSICAAHGVLLFDARASDCSRGDWQKRDDESIGRRYRSIPKYWLELRLATS